jgi:hypothetical protein
MLATERRAKSLASTTGRVTKYRRSSSKCLTTVSLGRATRRATALSQTGNAGSLWDATATTVQSRRCLKSAAMVLKEYLKRSCGRLGHQEDETILSVRRRGAITCLHMIGRILWAKPYRAGSAASQAVSGRVITSLQRARFPVSTPELCSGRGLSEEKNTESETEIVTH